MLFLKRHQAENICVVSCNGTTVLHQKQIGSPILRTEIYTRAFLSAERADRDAMLINAAYDTSERSVWEKWVACDSFSKMSSRAAADFLPAFARAAGEIVPAENVRIDRPFDTGCTDMGDISCVMPAIHAFGCGAEGAGHGADYRIVDFDSAVADSAKVQLTLLRMLLCDGGREAKRVIDNATPVFPDREKYFEAQDGFTITKRAVVYENGGARVSWEA